LIEQEVTWLCGEFEGEAVGRFFTQKVSHKQGIGPFQLCMKSGLLRNVEQTEEPVFDGVEHVFKQELVHDVLIESKDKKFVKFSIPSFHLFDWKEVSYFEMMDGGKKILLTKVTGKAYFPVTEALLEKPVRDEGLPNSNALVNDKSLNFEPVNLCWARILLLGFVLSLIVAYASGWLSGILFALPVVLVTLVSKFQSEISRNPIFRFLTGFNFTHLFIMLLMMSLTGVYLLYSHSCEDEGSFITILGLILSGFAFLLSILLKPCWNKWLLLLLWFISILLWSSFCEPEVQKKVKIVQQTISEKTEEAKDVIDEKVARRVPVREALENPELLKNKYNTLYFEDAVVFGFDKFDVSEHGSAKLETFVKLLKQYPNSKLTIVGHTDQHGEQTKEGHKRNQELSELRANAIKDFLMKRGSFDEGRLLSKGVGASDPVHRYPISEREFEENRRVEYHFKIREKQP